MKTLVIQWRCGPAQGRTVTFTQPVVTFGREAGSSLLIPESYVSRRHGEIRQQDDGWVLVNLSPNGTRVNRHLVKDQAHKLSAGDIIRIGDIEVFEVSFIEKPTAAIAGRDSWGATSHGSTTAQASGKPSLSRRTKLWVGLIVWWVVMLSGFVFFLTLDNKPDATHQDTIQVLSSQQIQEILTKRWAPQPPSAVDYRRHIEEGRSLAGSLQASRSNLYKAFREYQSALSVAENRRFEDDLDQLTFESLQTQIVEQTQERYRQAYARLRAGQFHTAATEFSRLADDLYHLFRLERQNLLVENVQSFEKDARSKVGKKR